MRIQPGDLSLLQAARDFSDGRHFLYLGSPPESRPGSFDCRAKTGSFPLSAQICSILTLRADKKEIRKLESKALELARDLIKRAA
jgi:hypothetical protein